MSSIVLRANKGIRAHPGLTRPRASTDQAMRASLLASAIASTLWEAVWMPALQATDLASQSSAGARR
jgi:hypothetical protein